MLRRLLAAFCCGFAVSSGAATDVNTATQAQLESIKGVGPAMSEAILAERRRQPFESWNDLVSRVNGIGAGTAARFSADGLTVSGAIYPGRTSAAATTPASGKARRHAIHEPAATRAAANDRSAHSAAATSAATPARNGTPGPTQN